MQWGGRGAVIELALTTEQRAQALDACKRPTPYRCSLRTPRTQELSLHAFQLIGEKCFVQLPNTAADVTGFAAIGVSEIGTMVLMNPALAQRVCSICKHEGFRPLQVRSDGKLVIRCEDCQMGVLECIPEDLSAFYDDGYYGLGGDSGGAQSYGYENYLFTAEHGVSWAAALIKLLCPSGSVLDIGCADGHLLKKLGPSYEIFGIEASETMGEVAQAAGINLLGRDLLDTSLRVACAGRFDVISSIAVFEHIRDIRAAFEAALDMLRNGGLLLFEVPLISSRYDNTVWFTSSLEHVWYPSETGLRQLVEGELGYHLIGSEIHIRTYGSTYVGIVVRDASKALEIRAITARVLTREEDANHFEERVARMQIGMMHAATTTPTDIETLAAMPVDALNSMMLRRLADLWQMDIDRCRMAEEEKRSIQAELLQAQARLIHLESSLAALSSDSARNDIALTREIISLREKLKRYLRKLGQ